MCETFWYLSVILTIATEEQDIDIIVYGFSIIYTNAQNNTDYKK